MKKYLWEINIEEYVTEYREREEIISELTSHEETVLKEKFSQNARNIQQKMVEVTLGTTNLVEGLEYIVKGEAILGICLFYLVVNEEPIRLETILSDIEQNAWDSYIFGLNHPVFKYEKLMLLNRVGNQAMAG